MSDDSKLVPSAALGQLERTAFDRVLDLARDKSVDEHKLEKILQLGREMEDSRRRAAFIAALTALHADVGALRIGKDGHIVVERDGRVVRDTAYATLENIDKQVRPLLEQHGFSLSFDTKSPDGKAYLITGFLRHREGHVESASLLLPVDTGPGRNGPQSVASTISYGRRHLYKMLLNLIEEGEDDDGEAKLQGYISQAQADALRLGVAEAWPGVPSAEGKFLKWLKAESFEAIEKRAWERAKAAVLKAMEPNGVQRAALEAALRGVS